MLRLARFVLTGTKKAATFVAALRPSRRVLVCRREVSLSGQLQKLRHSLTGTVLADKQLAHSPFGVEGAATNKRRGVGTVGATSGNGIINRKHAASGYFYPKLRVDDFISSYSLISPVPPQRSHCPPSPKSYPVPLQSGQVLTL